MRSNLAALFATIAAVVMAGGCEDAVSPNPPQPAGGVAMPKWLTVVTPHNERIRNIFSTRFSDWYFQKEGRTVYIRWEVAGTPECIASINRAEGRTDAEAPAVMFGGGIADHEALMRRGQSAPVLFGEQFDHIPPEACGLPTRHPEGYWYATGLSSFGILYNAEQSRKRRVTPPARWSDLAEPRFAGWLGIADPAASGSHLECFTVILQKHGWADGWSLIHRILANSRALVDRSSVAVSQTATGVFLASFAVNFDGRILEERTNGTVRYFNPPEATTVTPDVVSVLSMAPDPELARAFVEFCLTENAQTLWGARGGEGMLEKPLYHYPIDPNVYEEFHGELVVDENPFGDGFGVEYDLDTARMQRALLTPLVHAAAGENHVLLQQAWQAVIDAGMPAELVNELTRPPFDEADSILAAERLMAADAAIAARMQAEWAEMFAGRYRKVLSVAEARAQ